MLPYSLKEAELLGKTGRQLIPSDFKPSVAISAKFANTTVELGNTIEVDAAQKEPQVHFVVEVSCSRAPSAQHRN